ncbi:hypothetical protein [Saccharibacillus alkalitolerans]|uniref:Uncharacterized protein n=1 Tax=Saccharibacillus alkalitolerans TaxID=2705290 RepID=A0ABX0FC87_9BACL|nr:hypothetical protein [Saccharibacillus alkalitolerans]NGZ77659.1 hypothetical protein [Saccharibacillus alkalitolerans]
MNEKSKVWIWLSIPLICGALSFVLLWIIPPRVGEGQKETSSQKYSGGGNEKKDSSYARSSLRRRGGKRLRR